MERTKKFAKIFLCVSLALMLLCGVVVSAVQTNGGKVTMKELNIETDDGYSMSAYLFIPDSATKENKAPAVVTSHGYLNNKEMTDANYVELARRGFVVLAIDQPDHGDSEVIKDFNILAPTGVYQGVLALSRMPFVDTERIGITGHSMGSWSCNAAVLADNAAEKQLISSVLIHCNEPIYADDDGNYTNVYGSRDVGVISAMYDEFFGKWAKEDGTVMTAPTYMQSPSTQSFLNFGKAPTETREAYKYYTETVDGKEATRIVYNPPIIHPWSHFSARSESYVCDFFQKTLGAPNSIEPTKQVWQVKEAFNFIGVIGFAMFICSFATLLLFTPTFESLRASEPVKPMETDKKGKLWFFGTLVLGAVFGCLVYLPLVALGNGAKVAQGEALGLGLWSTACGLFTIASMIVYYFAYGKKNGFDLKDRGVVMPLKKFGLTALMAIIVFGVAYALVFVEDYFFFADFRLWTLAIKAFELPILKYIPYILLFFTYYIACSVATNSFNFNKVGKEWGNAIICGLFNAAPAIILPSIQYITYYSTNHMMWYQKAMGDPNYPMFVLWLFPIILILFGTTIVSRVIYKSSKNPYIAGIVNALIVGLVTIINTCTVVVA